VSGALVSLAAIFGLADTWPDIFRPGPKDRDYDHYRAIAVRPLPQGQNDQLRGLLDIFTAGGKEREIKVYRQQNPVHLEKTKKGTSTEAMLRAIALVHRRLRGIRGGLVASVHDELLLEVAEADAEAARRILEETMVEAFEVTFPGAPTNKVVEVRVGRTWKDVK
jgi:hypothetical protein